METINIILLTIFAPLVAFFVSLVFFIRQTKIAMTIVLAGGACSLLGSLYLLAQGPQEPLRYLWFQSGDFQLQFGFLLDGLSLWFGAVVALITFCVQMYSISYMDHDPDRSRFFAMLGLFGWAMLGFVYAVDFLQGFIFWELVGLASFFLIGFWYEKPSAVMAAKKAFIMTRIGDVGLLIGLLMTLNYFGGLDYLALVDPETGLQSVVSDKSLAIIMFLIFVGIMGKSAQFPLHTWLPDAMEGPTPVSALLHSATMVAAGVFLFARLHPLFMASAIVCTVVLAIAVFTAVLSSTIAMVEKDIKKVLAYSSISQLGFMLMGLAAGSLFAGVFHLITHALFKALLFLCAGSYIHHFATNDMEEIGRKGGRKMLFTTIGLISGGMALAGIPGLAGFFSKEEIFAALGHHGFSLFVLGAFVAAFLTAYYTFRMIFLVVLPAKIEESHDDGHHHASDCAISMRIPIMVLSIGAILGGALSSPIANGLGIERVHHALVSMLPAIITVFAGIALAWFDFGRKQATRKGFITMIPPVQKLFVNKWYIDAFYQAVVVKATWAMATLMHKTETKGIDRGFDELGHGVFEAGESASYLQSGWVQVYAGTASLLIGAFALYLGLR
jgi:NADH-quinone oxidoreductase subunit L